MRRHPDGEQHSSLGGPDLVRPHLTLVTDRCPTSLQFPHGQSALFRRAVRLHMSTMAWSLPNATAKPWSIGRDAEASRLEAPSGCLGASALAEALMFCCPTLLPRPSRGCYLCLLPVLSWGCRGIPNRLSLPVGAPLLPPRLIGSFRRVGVGSAVFPT